MKTEEILRYEAEYQAMQEAFVTHLLIFVFVKHEGKLNIREEKSLQRQVIDLLLRRIGHLFNKGRGNG